ncbi:hypothetical protein Hamer_G027936 [Homarus americanus]|uniref:Uncharacterized protein n=1 Tax=Homarus americanus TaxID=6706 RepID=A0A8J5MJC4_HOMAM|nr:hypothetical protein Hamer_G027936 [Homarus americanus]
MKYMLTLLVVTVTVMGATDNKTRRCGLGAVTRLPRPPDQQAQNIVCQSPSANLGVNCEVFKLEDCDNERLIISDGTTSSTLCGNITSTWVFPTNEMKLEFITNGDHNSPGYKCSITCLGEQTKDQLQQVM